MKQNMSCHFLLLLCFLLVSFFFVGLFCSPFVLCLHFVLLRLTCSALHTMWEHHTSQLCNCIRIFLVNEQISLQWIPNSFELPDDLVDDSQLNNLFNDCIRLLANVCFHSSHNFSFESSRTLKRILLQANDWGVSTMKAFKDSQIKILVQRVLWIRGMVYLAFCKQFAQKNSWLSEINKRITPLTVQSYDWKWFNHPFVVYAKLSLKSSYSYIGMTEKSMINRELSRMRKFKQVRLGKLTNVESSVRWWHGRKNFFEFTPIVIRQCTSKLQAAIWESQIISRWQPDLNMPKVALLMKEHKVRKNGTSHVEVKAGRFKPGFKLWKKTKKKESLQKSTYLLGKPTRSTSSMDWHLRACKIIQYCASNTIHRFRAQKRLRSWKTPPEQLYALYRQAHLIEEPARGKAIAGIKACMNFRNLTVPKQARTLVILPLAHPAFLAEVKRWIVEVTTPLHLKFLPFHLPPKSAVEGKHKSIAKLLHNFKQCQTKWTVAKPTKCPCTEFLKTFPDTPSENGHVVANGEDFINLPEDVQSILTACSEDTVYPAKANYLANTLEAVNSWSDHHQGPNLSEQWSEFIGRQWPSHLAAILQRGSHSFHAISKCRQLLKEFVIHVEDHAPAKTMVFCPVWYHSLVYSTFRNKDIFRKHKSNELQAKQAILENFPRQLQEVYRWGMAPEDRLAQSYIFPKRKKHWTNARPIITFAGTVLAPLWKAISTLLTGIIPSVFPESLHFRDVFDTFADLKTFFRKNCDKLPTMTMDNDDLSGFFTSVPQDRILEAVNLLLSKYLQNNPRIKFHSCVFTVMCNKGTTDGRVIRGRARTTATSHTVHFCHLESLVKYCLESSVFVSLGKIFSQSRGACMGSPLAPVLCSLVATVEEYFWRLSFQSVLLSQVFLTRYVDNRLVISPKYIRDHPSMIQFLDLSFYRPPVCLEQVGDLTVLGFTVCLMTKTIKYIVPSHSWQFRSVKSASSSRILMSGFVTRLHIICRCSFPRSSVSQSIEDLMVQYIKRGFDKVLVARTASRIVVRYKLKLNAFQL